MTDRPLTYTPGCTCPTCLARESEHPTFLYPKDVPPAVAIILNDIQRLPVWQYLILSRELTKHLDV